VLSPSSRLDTPMGLVGEDCRGFFPSTILLYYDRRGEREGNHLLFKESQSCYKY
jgi:hypothetical protein